MKYRWIILALVAAIPFSVCADERIAGSDGIDSGGYGGPVVKFMFLNDDLRVIVGGRGGWIINHTFAIGGGYYGLPIDSVIYGETAGVEYGGFEFEYILRLGGNLHLTAHVGIGGAEITDGGSGQVRYFYGEPSVNVEIGITQWFRVDAGVGYLWTYNSQDIPWPSASDLRNVTGSIVFKFGSF